MRAAQVARIRRASAEDGLLALQQNVGNSAVQRLLEDAPGERRLGPRQVRTLQRAAGNQAVETLLTRPQRVGQTGLQRSVVLAHLQRLHDAARAETPSYRADIASFQRRYSSADIAAHQRTVLGPQSADNSAVLRRKGSDQTAGAVATREGRLKRGPSYTPSGSITAGTSGERQTTRFDFTAEFENDPKKGIYAACCEVRQYIKWSHTPPKHAGFGTGLSADTWYEDRDAVDKRYGHRSGPHSENIPGNQYVNKKGSPDQANGVKYEGNDNPGIKAGSRTGETWDFMVKVIDTCNGDKVLGTDTVSVKW